MLEAQIEYRAPKRKPTNSECVCLITLAADRGDSSHLQGSPIFLNHSIAAAGFLAKWTSCLPWIKGSWPKGYSRSFGRICAWARADLAAPGPMVGFGGATDKPPRIRAHTNPLTVIARSDGSPQRLFQVGDQILDRFQTDRQTQHAVRNAATSPLRRRQFVVRRRAGLGDQAFGAAETGCQGKELEPIGDACGVVSAADYLDGQHTAKAVHLFLAKA